MSLSIDEFCRRVQKGLEQATWEQKRQLIEWLVVRVVVTDGDVEIRYAIPTSSNGKAVASVICIQTIENFFCDLKQFRRIAARYDRTDQSFTAMIYLATSLGALR